ncbi:MAG: 50S ribosomal protein L25 [Planctomycetota bacterium]|jgi:large subunit ribosomal protein L25
MQEVVIETQPRTEMGTRAARRLRKSGTIPVTLCAKGRESSHLQVAERQLEKVLRAGARVITVVHPGGRDKAFLKEVQYDHLGEKVYHVDLTKVAAGEKVELEVELVLKGKPVGVTEEEGVLDQYIKALKIACLPDAIPKKIDADVAHLKLKDHLTIADLVPPPGVTLLQEQDLVLAAVNEPKVEEVVPAVAETGPMEPEVIKKEKPDEEGEAAPEGEKKEKKEKKEE